MPTHSTPTDKAKLITCLLSKGSALVLLKQLKEEKGITRANVNSARGSGMGSPVGGKKGLGKEIEKDVLTVVVSVQEADDIFEFIYHAAGVGRPHGGFMYMTALAAAVPFLLPDLPEA